LENSLAVPPNVKIESLYDLAIPLLGTYQGELNLRYTKGCTNVRLHLLVIKMLKKSDNGGGYFYDTLII
jgi:hypothetical protein